MDMGRILIIISTLFLLGAGMYERDVKVIEALKNNGSDVSKPHNIDFFLDFKEFDSAAPVAQEMDKDGFNVKVFENQDGTYTIEAKKIVIPSISNMTKISNKLHGLTNKYGGEYDGWGTEVVE